MPWFFLPLSPRSFLHRVQRCAELLSSSDPIELASLPLVGYAADDNAYADGTRSINSGHWSDAIAIFSRIAAPR